MILRIEIKSIFEIMTINSVELVKIYLYSSSQNLGIYFMHLSLEGLLI